MWSEMKNKNLLDRIDEFQKLAKNAKKEFLKKLSQETDTQNIVNQKELSDQSVSYEGLENLLSSIKSKLNECQRLSMNLYQAARSVAHVQNDELFKNDVSMISQALTKAQEFVNGFENGRASPLKAESVASTLRSTVNELSSNVIDYSDQKITSLTGSLKASMYECADLLGDISRYSSRRSNWKPYHQSDVHEMMTGTQGLNDLGDIFEYELNNLEQSPTPSKEKFQQLANKLNASKSSLNKDKYEFYWRQLQNIKTKIQNQLKGGPAVKQKPQV